MDMKFFLNKYYPTPDDLVRFLSSRQETGKIVCKFCDQNFVSREQFETHSCYRELRSALDSEN